MRSHSCPNARSLHISSTKRMPAFTKNEIRPTTSGRSSSATWPDSRTASRTPIAVASAYAISWTGVAPASWRWYEHTLIGFHNGALRTEWQIRSTVRRRDASGPKMYVPRLRYSLTMSFCVVPARPATSAPRSSASATYMPYNHIAVALIVIDVFISSSGRPSNRARMSPRCGTGTPTLPTSPWASGWSGS